MISLDKFDGRFNTADYLSAKIYVLNKTKRIAKINEAKTLIKHISFDCKCKFDSALCNLNQKRNIKHVNASVKIIISSKKIIVASQAKVFVKMANIKKLLLMNHKLCVMKS